MPVNPIYVCLSATVKNAGASLCIRGTMRQIVISGVSLSIGLCCALHARLPSTMLFKTLSASVYGIDAYLVEVEVDVGSARMQDFNVVGLPDNAVKESRERIKSALRNCGFEFPHGQGVTINLAPADVRKEGSAFDLPMALGLAGGMGQFFGEALDKMMLLGVVSVDGGERPGWGAVSAAVVARDHGVKAVAVAGEKMELEEGGG